MLKENLSLFLAGIKENLSFILVCILVVAGLALIAKVCEKYFCKSFRRVTGARYIAYVAMFAALGGVLMMFEIPLFFAPSFYKIDLGELPVLMSAFYLGPVAGVVTEFLKVCIKLLLKGSSTAFIGDFANFAVGCSFILPAAIIYHRHKTRKNAIIGMVVGTLVMTIVGSAFNAYYLIPKYAEMFMPMDAIIGMGTKVNSKINSVGTLVMYAVVPFNLLKGVVDSVLTYLLYKRVEPILFRESRRESKPTENKSNA